MHLLASSPVIPSFKTQNTPIKTVCLQDNFNTSLSFLFPLPEEVAVHVLSFLTAEEVCTIARVSRTLKRLADDGILWRKLCKRQRWVIPRSVVLDQTHEFDYKRYYSEKHTLLKPESLKWGKPKIKGTPPSKRFKHTATVVGKHMIMIGGQETDTKRFNDILYFDLHTKTFTQPVIHGDAVPKFSRHVSCLIGKRIFVFGGFDGFGTNFDLSCFDPYTRVWTNLNNNFLNGSIPASRTNHAAAAVGNKMYVFGGNNCTENGGYQVLDDLSVLDVETMTWSQPATTGEKPSARSGHTLTAIGKKLYLFGGGVWNERQGWVHKFNDIYVLDTETMHWTKPECQGTVNTATFAISFNIGRFLFVFGGGSKPDHCVTNDLYVLDTSSFVWQVPDVVGEKPNPRDMGTACVLPEGNVYLVGGYAGGAVEHINHLRFNSPHLFSP